MIDGRNFFDETVKNDLTTNDNIRKIGTGQGDAYMTWYLLNYPDFENQTTKTSC